MVIMQKISALKVLVKEASGSLRAVAYTKVFKEK